MLTYIGKRFFQLIPVLLGVVLLTFLLMRLIPGDPTELTGQTVSEEVRTALRAKWHLDKPVLVQFGYYLKGLVQLDLGVSMRRGDPVMEMVLESFVRTMYLGLSAFIISVTLGIGLGIFSALMKDTWVDRVVMMLALVGISTPVFVVGIVLILVAVAVGYNYISATSMQGMDVRYLVLPALTLGSRSIAYLARMTRASILEVSHSDFLRTARAKGLSERVVVFKHLMKNAMIPIITVVGLNFADYLTGAILTETVFQWPGVGFLMRTAILARDIPVITGAVLFTTTIFLLINFVVDLLYAFFDPRIRFSN